MVFRDGFCFYTVNILGDLQGLKRRLVAISNRDLVYIKDIYNICYIYLIFGYNEHNVHYTIVGINLK